MMRFFFTVISLIPIIAFAQAQHVFVDGITNDWQACTNKFTDEAGDGDDIDILQLRMMNDEQYLYIALKTYEEVQLSQDNQLTLLLDTDGNPETGYKFNRIGAELKWDFGRRRGTFYINGGTASVWHNDIGFYALPTVTAKEFEMAFKRNAKPDGVNRLFLTDSVRIVVFDNQPGDKMPEEDQFITYHFDNTVLPTIEPLSVSRNSSAHLRLMTWNVLQDGFTDPQRAESFERIITAISPDIITFNEAWDTQASTVKAMLNRILPLNNGSGWQAHKLVDGNITASRYPMVQSYDVVPGKRVMASHINLPDDIYAKDLVVFNCHLKCCNSDGDNETRQYEIDGLMSFVNKMKSGNSPLTVDEKTPFVFMGDMNLVGTSENLLTLINGVDGEKPDWDETGMDDDIARNISLNMAYTFTEEETSYWPGRLDYILYTGSQLKLQNSFIFESRYISAEQLNQLNVYASDNSKASDHLPHIADFTIEATNNNFETGYQSTQLYPNPASDRVTITGFNGFYECSYNIVDVFGISRLAGKLKVYNSAITINIGKLPVGIYTVEITTLNGFRCASKLFIRGEY